LIKKFKLLSITNKIDIVNYLFSEYFYWLKIYCELLLNIVWENGLSLFIYTTEFKF